MRAFAICILAACLILPACGRESRTSAAGDGSIAAERDRYQDLMRARLQEFEHRFDGLEARMKGLNQADQEHLRIDIAELRERKDVLERKFDDMKSVSAESWLDLKASLDRKLDELEAAYNIVAANNHGSHEPIRFDDPDNRR